MTPRDTRLIRITRTSPRSGTSDRIATLPVHLCLAPLALRCSPFVKADVTSSRGPNHANPQRPCLGVPVLKKRRGSTPCLLWGWVRTRGVAALLDLQGCCACLGSLLFGSVRLGRARIAEFGTRLGTRRSRASQRLCGEVLLASESRSSVTNLASHGRVRPGAERQFLSFARDRGPQCSDGRPALVQPCRLPCLSPSFGHVPHRCGVSPSVEIASWASMLRSGGVGPQNSCWSVRPTAA